MTPLLWAYVAIWSAFCAAAAVVAWRTVRLDPAAVRGFLFTPWKLAVFVPGVLFVSLAGRFTDDETWDVVSGAGMSLLTVSTSWWAVGTLARVARGRAPMREMLVAVAATLFSSSWFYDGWLLARDGAYTRRWLANLMISPVIYLCAGLVSNLEIDEDRKLALAFTRADWPRPAVNAGRLDWKLVLAALPLVAIAVWLLVGTVGWTLPR